MIRLEKITKKYYTKDIVTTALLEVNLRVEEGEFISVMGPSGCGKTTLLNVLGLLDEFSDGEYQYRGNPIRSFDTQKRDVIAKDDFAFIFQNYNLIPGYSVAKNVELPLIYEGVGRSDRIARVNKSLEYVNLSHRARHKPNQLSGGQQQRVAVARALVKRPRVIFADEPTGNLDSENGLHVMELLKKLNQDYGTTIIMVSHSVEFANFGDRILHLFDGQIVSDTDPKFYT